jgi:hypothetical protein
LWEGSFVLPSRTSFTLASFSSRSVTPLLPWSPNQRMSPPHLIFVPFPAVMLYTK